MHYYERNIGDYYRKAGRLNILQHGVYTLLIDACYDREQFPTLDEAIDWVWAETDEEVAAVKFVLRKFFKLNESGVYLQNHIEEDLIAYKNFLTKQSENGKKGGRPPKNNPKDNLGNSGIDLDGIGINESTQINPNKPNESLNHRTIEPINQEPSNQILNPHTQETCEEKNSLDEILNLWNPDLKMVNDWLRRAGASPFTQKQFDEFKPAFLNHYAPQIQNGLLKPDKLFGKLVVWVKRDYKSRDAPKPTKNQSKPSASVENRNVNDAWDALGEMEKPDPNWVDTTDYSSPDWEDVI